MKQIKLFVFFLLMMFLSCSSPDSEVAVIEERTAEWFKLWSPKDKPATFDAVDDLFASEEEGLLVVDGFEGGAITIRSPKTYREKWKPMINSMFSYYEVEPDGPIYIEQEGNMAYSNFIWKAKALSQEGDSIPLSQHATHIWKKLNGQWKIVHEHLTNIDMTDKKGTTIAD